MRREINNWNGSFQGGTMKKEWIEQWSGNLSYNNEMGVVDYDSHRPEKR